MYDIITPESFLKRSKKFFQRHPQLKERFRSLVQVLSKDPWQSSLRLHPLKGNLDGLYALSLTYSFRVTLTIQFSENEITLLDIGSHDEVYEKSY